MNNYTDKQIDEFNKGQAKETRQAIDVVGKYIFVASVAMAIFAGIMWAYSQLFIQHPLIGLIVIVIFAIVSFFILMFLKSLGILK